MEMEGKTIILTTPQELSRVVVEALHSALTAPGFLMPSKKRLLSAKDIAAEFGIAKRTLEHWRAEGTGPAYTMVGGRIFYERAKMEAYIAAGRVRPADGSRRT
jgi:predicted site-specific integrase-resolvase